MLALLPLLLLLLPLLAAAGHWQADCVCEPLHCGCVRHSVRSAGHCTDEDRPVPGLGVPGEEELGLCDIVLGVEDLGFKLNP